MRTRVLLVAATVFVLAAPAAACAATHERPDLLHHFTDAGTTGTMVVREAGRGGPQTIVVGARAQPPPLPAVLDLQDPERAAGDRPRRGLRRRASPTPGPNPNFLVDGKPFLPVACEGDLTLATAFANSCIPIYQRIARQLGRATYRRAVRAMDYGNRDVDGAPVDSFWLRGPVRDLRPRAGALPRAPAPRRAARLAPRAGEVREMMVVERTATRSCCAARPATSSRRPRASAGGSAGCSAAPRRGRSR